MTSNQPIPVPEDDEKLMELRMRAKQDIPDTKRLSILLQVYHVTPSAKPTSLREHCSKELETDEQTYYRSLKTETNWKPVSLGWLSLEPLSLLLVFNRGKSPLYVGNNLKQVLPLSDRIEPNTFFSITAPHPSLIQHLVLKSEGEGRAEVYAIPN